MLLNIMLFNKRQMAKLFAEVCQGRALHTVVKHYLLSAQAALDEAADLHGTKCLDGFN